ncbi:CPBP family intramembrane glutamic endopeptidase [Roseiconus lacunae]|uniref:CPBP family intramembrane glutamic endopeptidase n=1 Tax=Roseiconus lacunae TaxID=2605694 RepID=UPI001E29AA08|nr:CPBP family intramembrane glutamic endopeptidase [Roseiconus lacunae]MCD0458813.1 CPBP family intramembrane metalloprotease [Roseiconus lacunae]
MDEDLTPEHDSPDELMFVWACGFELAIGVVGLIVASIVGFDARAYLPRIEDVQPLAILKDIGIGIVASVPMLIVVYALLQIPHRSIDAIKRLSDAPTMKAILSFSYPELIVLSICAGIGEELAFRGCLLPWFTAIDDPSASIINPYDVGDGFAVALPSLLIAAIIFSSVAFGLLHPITKLYVVIASLMGVYFAMLLIVTESLLIPIVAHAAFDAIQFVIAKNSDEEEKDDDDSHTD